jgi:hypothetical protein
MGRPSRRKKRKAREVAGKVPVKRARGKKKVVAAEALPDDVYPAWDEGLMNPDPNSLVLEKAGKGYRGYIFTIFPDQAMPDGVDRPDCEELLKGLPFSYMIFGREVCPRTGSFHLQGYMYLANQRSYMSVLKGFAPWTPFLRVAFGTGPQNRNYCSKDGDFWEKGVVPSDNAKRGAEERNRHAYAVELARQGRIDEIEPQLLVQSIRNLQLIEERAILSRPLPTLVERRNMWICGPSDCGKGAAIRRIFRACDLYDKPATKWYHDYRGEPVVLVDETNRNFKWAADHVRRWCDYAPYIGEKKHGHIRLRPNHVFFLANTHPRDVFAEENAENLNAILNRFIVLDLFRCDRSSSCECPKCTPGIYPDEVIRRVLRIAHDWWEYDPEDGMPNVNYGRDNPCFRQGRFVTQAFHPESSVRVAADSREKKYVEAVTADALPVEEVRPSSDESRVSMNSCGEVANVLARLPFDEGVMSAMVADSVAVVRSEVWVGGGWLHDRL